MRSRYTAYVEGNVDYIINTHNPDKPDEVDRESTEMWSKQSQWLGLEIVRTEGGRPEDRDGIVEFVARYKLKGVTVSHRERAEFEKRDGKWYFMDGQQIASPPVRKLAPSVGRNDPCVCGSGKKYKKCCGRAG